MARRNLPPESGPRIARPPESATRTHQPARPRPASEPAAETIFFPDLGEFLRRAALGLLALLVVARAYYPSEDADTGSGLPWVLLVVGVSGLAVAANLLTGTTRLRWSWADGFVLALMVLVALSAGHAADRRAAITMAWEWGAMGLLYALARNLPRTRAELSALALVLTATAVAVAAYGLYQASVEFPQIRLQFERNPAGVLATLGIPPDSSAAESFRQRLLYSNEPFSTFALANSLAGFLVGPLVLLLATGLESLKRDGRGRSGWGLVLATMPGLILLVCLLLTKSRSAYAGGVLGVLVLAWSYRAVVPRRWLVGLGLTLAFFLAGLIAVGVSYRQLDVQILTEAKKSLGYRWEYWVGTWGIITDAPSPFGSDREGSRPFGSLAEEPTARSSGPFWWGVGPANFAGPYLRHKLPEASEQIRDPHNAILEVWAESGFFAMLALVAAIGTGIWQIVRRRQSTVAASADRTASDGGEPSGGTVVPRGTGWLVLMGGLGWFGVWALGKLNPLTQNDMTMRWIVLGVTWLATIFLAGPILSRREIPAVGVGAAALALAVELQAAGGIGIPAVAMMLWLLLAIGLDLRDDQPGGRLRTGGLGLGVALACGWAVLAGTFAGAVMPGWRSSQMLAAGDAAMTTKPPRYEVARQAFEEAIRLDHFAVEPWLALADLEYRFWRSPEGGDRRKPTWNLILLAMDKALEGTYRDPDRLDLRQRQAGYARLILNDLPDDAKPLELLPLKTTIAKATRHAVRLFPTSAPLRAELAQASADLGMYPDAVSAARVAMQLDDLMPHADRKLPTRTRAMLESQLKAWETQAKVAVPQPAGR